jgi:tetratricopeptide (TPR) repeat protein
MNPPKPNARFRLRGVSDSNGASARLVREGSRLLAVAFLALGQLSESIHAGEPFVPLTDDTILIRLPRDLRSNLAPGAPAVVGSEVETSEQAVRKLLAQARHDGDPGPLRRALRRLESASDSESRPSEKLLLRAQVRQALQDFTGALADLEAVLQRDPNHPGAWLSKASIHQVRGEFAEARRACLHLARCGDGFVATVAAASLTGVTTLGDGATKRLAETLGSPAHAGIPAELRAWGWTALAELEAMNGHPVKAEAAFREAIRLEPSHPYPALGLADLLLAAGRPSEVLVSLKTSPALNARIRVAEALRQTAPDGPETVRILRELDETFALAQLRGEDLHRREHARFLLRLRHQPAEALALALDNWKVQKEPADLQLLLEAAAAARNGTVRDAALAWASTNMPALLQNPTALRLARNP